MVTLDTVLATMNTPIRTNKAAAKFQAAASCHNQLTHPADLARAKVIVELSERCHNHPIRNLVRSRFTPERAYSTYFAYMQAVSARCGPDCLIAQPRQRSGLQRELGRFHPLIYVGVGIDRAGLRGGRLS
jgi:hypothetical protein